MQGNLAACVWSWVFRTCGIACVEVQWFCFGNVFGNHNDPKVQFTFSNLFGNTFEDLDDFKMYLHFVWFRESIFGSQALGKFDAPVTFWLKREKECCPRGLQGCRLVTLREKVPADLKFFTW